MKIILGKAREGKTSTILSLIPENNGVVYFTNEMSWEGIYRLCRYKDFNLPGRYIFTENFNDVVGYIGELIEKDTNFYIDWHGLTINELFELYNLERRYDLNIIATHNKPVNFEDGIQILNLSKKARFYPQEEEMAKLLKNETVLPRESFKKIKQLFQQSMKEKSITPEQARNSLGIKRYKIILK